MPLISSLPVVAKTAFFFDFDGTLCALAPTPDAVAVSPRVIPLLQTLRDRNDLALAIITGRPIADIDRFLAPLVLPVAGSHGAERRGLDGDVVKVGFGDPRVREMEQRLNAVVGANAGLLLEVKGAGLALHYRAAPQLADLARQASEEVVARFAEAFVLQPGKMVFEIKPQGVDKGRAIQSFLAQAPFAGRTPFFAGDDLTDEKGFAQVNALGGLTMKIGEGETLARERLPDVEAFVDWLDRVVSA